MGNFIFSATVMPNSQLTFLFAILFVVCILISVHIILLCRNYSRLKNKHKEIESLFALHKTFIDAEDNIIYLKDSNLNYVFVNKTFQYFFELNDKEIIGRDDYALMHDVFAKWNRETDFNVLKSKTVMINDFELDNRIYRATKFPVRLSDDKIGIGAHIKDVTEEQKSIKQQEIYLQTLISIGDGVMVVDQGGRIEMINKEAEKLTGWQNTEAVGRLYGEVFSLSGDADVSFSDPVKDVLETGFVSELKNDALLLSKNGKKYYIEDCAAPIRNDMDDAVGVVVVFRDVTDKKLQRDRIEYLSYHDPLTGLYNRRFFEDELRRLDKEANLPISIIMGDVNGLKLTNDIFGHAFGDVLLIKVAEVLSRVCSEKEVIARWGGDEFVILLPDASVEYAKDLIVRIKKEFAGESIKAIKGSVSMGCSAKTEPSENIMQVLELAEDTMYSVKTLERDDIRNSAINSIISSLHENSVREKEHSVRVSELCQKLGRALNLPGVEVRKLKEAGYLHDIGKIVLEPGLMNKNHLLSNREWNEVKRHPIIGYRILNSFDNTLVLAESVLAHHERWNGSGYPKGLKGEEIPRLARIIAIVEGYDRMTHDSDNIHAMSREEAIRTLEENAGTLFDPGLVGVFTEMIRQEQ